jgi:eukaryotic-like serine/threonine-protein kinase
MPWLEGMTLGRWLAAGQRFDLPGALWIARQAAEGLGALATAGWIHGDVKPSNIFVSPEGHVTLVDLGFARRYGNTVSVDGRRVMGTIEYLAPENLTSSGGADPRSDIYSLGVVLFELLAGRVPFEGCDLVELAAHHKQTAPPDLRCTAPQLPAEAASLVRQMLSKDPLRRPQTPREVVARLVALEIATFSERA